ncbi:MAG TPA: tetratricopeptide repeat protein [Candidatus Acidoferrum sp.]|nr:tetratricopeptide repeat protein [Candidatus Acidoferrum sp.]
MILRLSSSTGRGFLVFLAVVLAAALSYSGIRNAFAVHDAGLHTPQGYERATQLEPDDARNWYLLARYWQYNLEDPDAQRAIRAYQTALTLNPLSADTWLDLGTQYESEGDLADTQNAFLQAKHVYPLSPEVSWRYGNFLLRKGEFDAAFAEIKRAVEVDPKRGAAAFLLCKRVVPDVNAVLDRVLPNSKDAYLSVLSALTEQQQTDQALVVWSRLATLHPRFPLRESFSLLEILIHKRQMVQAQHVWDQAVAIAGVARPSDPPNSLVWDGGFELNISGGGFAWRYPVFTGGVQVTLDSKVKHSGSHSLRLTFNGLSNVDFSDVCQYVPVQPSTAYRFSAWVRTRDLSTDQGVRFALHSISDSVNSISRTDGFRGNQPWTQISLPWNSEKDVSELQLCLTRLPSAKFDSKIHGSAWIDDVALVPESAESSKQ